MSAQGRECAGSDLRLVVNGFFESLNYENNNISSYEKEFGVHKENS